MLKLLTYVVILTNQTERNSRVYRGHGLLTGVTFMAIMAWQKPGMLNTGCIFSVIVTSTVCYQNNLTSFATWFIVYLGFKVQKVTEKSYTFTG